MRSFNCIPEPNAPTEVDERVEKYLVDNIDAIDHPTTTPRPPFRPTVQQTNSPKFDERTFELPEEMPAVTNKFVVCNLFVLGRTDCTSTVTR